MVLDKSRSPSKSPHRFQLDSPTAYEYTNSSLGAQPIRPSRCCSVCKKILIALAIWLMLVVLIFATHEGRYQWFKTVQRLSAAGLVPQTLDGILQKVTFISTIVGCKGDYGICGRAELGKFFVRLSGHETGYCAGFGPFQWFACNHERYKEYIYSTTLQRDPNVFIAAKLDQIHAGIIPSNTLLNLGTGDPEHTRRRQLIAEAITALQRHPTRPEVIIPSWASPSGDSSVIMRLTGLNIFKWMFDIDLEVQHLDMLMEFNSISGPIALGISHGTAREAEIVTNILQTLKEVIRQSDTGRNFARMSDERGMDTEERLTELTAILMFAGFGGTSAYAVQTIERIRSDRALYVPMYQADPVAFLKESARLNPPVGGLVVVADHDETITLGGDIAGSVLDVKKGTGGALWIPNANKDPKVFGGSDNSESYAFEFDPTRENLDKIMTWNGLLDDIERGWAPVPGTKGHAPRPCPGAIFALQLVEKVVDYFLPTHATAEAETRPAAPAVAVTRPATENRTVAEPDAGAGPEQVDEPLVEDAADASSTSGGAFTLTVNKISKGGTEQVQIEASPQDSVQDVIMRLEPNHLAELRHKGEFEDQPKGLSLLDVGISQDMQVDLMISDKMKGSPPSEPEAVADPEVEAPEMQAELDGAEAAEAVSWRKPGTDIEVEGELALKIDL